MTIGVVGQGAAVSLPDVKVTLDRLGQIMTADPRDPREAEGVLNPASAWRNGSLFVFPRLVAAGNVSRIGQALVTLTDGVPSGVERRNVALEAVRGWEHGATHGGVEDPRITWIPSLGLHVMTYVAFGPTGPRPAIAVSSDLTEWRRLGPVQFEYSDSMGTDLNLFPNKDVVFFPEVVADPDGVPSYAMLHRPMWDLSFNGSTEPAPLPVGLTDDRPSIWISYVPAASVEADITAIVRPRGHTLLASPLHPWEELKIGAGTPPIRTEEGWLLIYHGVSGVIEGGGYAPQQNVRYVAAAMILDANDPSVVVARSSNPILVPELDEETKGTVGNVVFPTAIERVGDEHYVFYGMADSSIGVAALRTAQ